MKVIKQLFIVLWLFHCCVKQYEDIRKNKKITKEVIERIKSVQQELDEREIERKRLKELFPVVVGRGRKIIIKKYETTGHMCRIFLGSNFVYKKRKDSNEAFVTSLSKITIYQKNQGDWK